MAVIGTVVICIGASVVALWPDGVGLLYGLFVPHTSSYPDWILSDPRYAQEFHGRSPWLEISLYMMAVGGGAYDYIGYIGMVRKKNLGLSGRPIATRAELDAAVHRDNPDADETISRARRWTRAPFRDTTISFSLVILVTLLFAILGALVLHPEHVVPANHDLLSEQERFLTHFHSALRWLYRTSVILAFVGTLYGAFEVYKHTFVESLRVIVPKLAVPERLPYVRAAVVLYIYLGGLILIWLPESLVENVVGRMTLISVLSGPATCGLWCFAMLWVERTRLPAPLRMGMPMKCFVCVAGAAMCIVGALILVSYVR